MTDNAMLLLCKTLLKIARAWYKVKTGISDPAELKD